ncbi:molybdopterin dinucleotide binding domain-containing protein, partial [Parendozoicomonas haliclonae]|uniref:molybdopterin dinucleotide binding domain-containing protein n=1 Tax=Parendozoicomonas haliclonae TaxID=1960125 RepID=UPI0039EE9F7F
AKGGREVGGLANQLAAHLEFHRPDDIERVSRFWQAPNMVQQPGLTAVDLLRAVESGEIRFIWIMGTNPVVSMPDADRVKAALQICPTVVVSDCIAPTDTGQCADILLPAAGWSEKDGTVTNSERRISRQRRFRPPTGEARADWAILSEVGRRLGHAEAFAYQCPADVFREHARLSALDNDPEARPRDFHIGGLAELSDQEYDQLQPVQWPLRSRTDNGTQRMFADGKFYTPSGKAQFVPIQETISAQATEAYPLLLNTGRIRDQWHTMTRTALAPRLNRHKDEPFLELNPADAASRGINDKALVTVRSSYGQSVLRATITDQVQPGQVFAPMHWTAQNSQTGRICSVAHPEVDPYSLQPDLKRTPVQIEAFHARQHAVLICRDKRPLPDTDYGVLVKGTDCYRYELADTENGLDGLRSELMAALGPHIVQYQDSELGIEKTLWLDDGKAVAVLMIGSEYPTEVDRSWLETLFASDAPEQPSWWQVLAGVPTSGCAGGKQVCACFGVGQETITAAIREQDLESVEDIGKTLKAGTNCGSCIPELRQLLTAIQVEEV